MEDTSMETQRQAGGGLRRRLREKQGRNFQQTELIYRSGGLRRIELGRTDSKHLKQVSKV